MWECGLQLILVAHIADLWDTVEYAAAFLLLAVKHEMMKLFTQTCVHSTRLY